MICTYSRRTVIVIAVIVFVFTVSFISILNFNAQTVYYNIKNRKTVTKRCMYTKLYPGGFGAKIHDMLFAWSYALQSQIYYKGAIGSFPRDKTLKSLIQLLNVPFDVSRIHNKSCDILSSYKYQNMLYLNRFFVHRTVTPKKRNRTIVVHIRRGDVSMDYEQTGDYYRYIPNQYFLNLLYNITQFGDNVIIFSQNSDSFQDFIDAGYKVMLDTSEFEIWKSILSSDIFIMSKSSFSYVPALFFSGIIYYNEFWAKPFPHWLSFPQNNFSGKTAITVPMTETHIPCEGGQFGAKHIQYYACVISKSNVQFLHIPHLAQVAYPCWSWFLSKRAPNCIFLFRDLRPTEWFKYIASKMGCLIVLRQPKRCTIIGVLNVTTGVGPGETYSWLYSASDSERLQKNIFQHKVPKKGKGILQRLKNRRINIANLNITYDVAFFENMTYFNQCKWINDHDLIIASHGAAITNAICLQKCAIVIQLYPSHYYPCGFYEPLIREAGGIAISWIQNKYLGRNKSLAQENENLLQKDFAGEHSRRGFWKLQNININNTILSTLIQRGKEEQIHCLNNNHM